MVQVSNTTKAVMFGCEGPDLLERESEFFAEVNPLGFILFKRNCHSRRQLTRLVDDLRSSVGRVDAPVAIDQEGGRVVRLCAPEWWEAPAPGVIGALADTDLKAAERAAWIVGRLNALQLREHRITINFAPSIDLRLHDAHSVIGDRAFHADPAVVIALGRAALEGHLDGGVLPVIKHIPGHGRAEVDSHYSLPCNTMPLEELIATDFKPFMALAGHPLAMTCHLVFTAIDGDSPATHSHRMIQGIIRELFGFSGLLLTDDISMAALDGATDTRCRLALESGCDVVLHCNGKLNDMRHAASAIAPLGERARKSVVELSTLLHDAGSIKPNELAAELDDLLATPGVGGDWSS